MDFESNKENIRNPVARQPPSSITKTNKYIGNENISLERQRLVQEKDQNITHPTPWLKLLLYDVSQKINHHPTQEDVMLMKQLFRHAHDKINPEYHQHIDFANIKTQHVILLMYVLFCFCSAFFVNLFPVQTIS
jgi:hypothetical protein